MKTEAQMMRETIHSPGMWSIYLDLINNTPACISRGDVVNLLNWRYHVRQVNALAAPVVDLYRYWASPLFSETNYKEEIFIDLYQVWVNEMRNSSSCVSADYGLSLVMGV